MIGSAQIVRGGVSEPCKGTCGRKTRPSRVLIDKAPGSVPRHGKGMCRSCYDKAFPERKVTPRPPAAKLEAGAARAADTLDAFMAARRARLEKIDNRRPL